MVCVFVVVRKLLGKGARARIANTGGRCLDDKAGCDMGVTGVVPNSVLVFLSRGQATEFTAGHA